MEINNMKNKVKVIFEYPKRLLGFGIIAKTDLEKLDLTVFLKDGRNFSVNEIKEITYRVKLDALEVENE